jgi:sulfatase modifying factor 1
MGVEMAARCAGAYSSKRMRVSRAGALLVVWVMFSALAFGCELFVNTNDIDTATDAGADHGATTDGPADGPTDGTTDGPTDTMSESLPADAACPGEAGPSMIRVGGYCIDSTEVTNADFEAFLSYESANPGVIKSPLECAWKGGSNDHDGGWQPATGATGPTDPVGNVDWCDAYMYCSFAGKRLCGQIGGGSTPYLSFTDLTVDQWYAACTGQDASAYPYSNTFDEKACNGLLEDGGYPDGASTYQVEPVENRQTCQGAYAGVYDLSGNVAEWEDCCDLTEGDAAANQPCRSRGGSAHSDLTTLRCDGPSLGGQPYTRSYSTDDLGFRCCSP